MSWGVRGPYMCVVDACNEPLLKHCFVVWGGLMCRCLVWGSWVSMVCFFIVVIRHCPSWRPEPVRKGKSYIPLRAMKKAVRAVMGLLIGPFGSRQPQWVLMQSLVCVRHPKRVPLPRNRPTLLWSSSSASHENCCGRINSPCLRSRTVTFHFHLLGRTRYPQKRKAGSCFWFSLWTWRSARCGAPTLKKQAQKKREGRNEPL